MSLARLNTFKMRGLMASPVVKKELARLAMETGHSMDHMVKLGVLQGWRMLNLRRFDEARVWMDEVVRLAIQHQMTHQVDVAKQVRRFAEERVAV